MYTEKEVVILMTKAFEAGFKQYEIVEAGLEGKETDEFVRWILLGFKKQKNDKQNNKVLETNICNCKRDPDTDYFCKICGLPKQ